MSQTVKHTRRKNTADAASRRLRKKFIDASVPGFEAACDPLEAQLAGAFVEDALSEMEARDSSVDLLDTVLTDDPDKREGRR